MYNHCLFLHHYSLCDLCVDYAFCYCDTPCMCLAERNGKNFLKEYVLTSEIWKSNWELYFKYAVSWTSTGETVTCTTAGI